MYLLLGVPEKLSSPPRLMSLVALIVPETDNVSVGFVSPIPTLPALVIEK